MISFRAMQPSDERFVVESFCDSYRDAHAAGLIQWDDWHEVMRPQWRKVLTRPGVVVTVCVFDGETPGVADIAGWIAVERGYLVQTNRDDGRRYQRQMAPAREPLVHYVYVKEGYRESGLARALFRAAGVDPALPFRFSCKTGVVTQLSSKVPYARWAPLIARQTRTHGQDPQDRRHTDPRPR